MFSLTVTRNRNARAKAGTIRLIESIRLMPAIGAVLVVLLCAAVSSWGSVFWAVPALESFAVRIAADYDTLVPEITIRNNRVSSREKQPQVLYVSRFTDLVLVMDTREVDLETVLNNLKDVAKGAVIAGETIVAKVGAQIAIVPLPELPDTVLNSRAIDEFFKQHLIDVKRRVTIGIILYSFAAKLLQILFFGLATFIGARLCSAPLTYGESTKVAAVAMMLPVLFDGLRDVAGLRIPYAFLVYFLLYVGLLSLILMNLAKNSRSGVDVETESPSL